MNKKYFKLSIVLLLIMTIFLSGCKGSAENKKDDYSSKDNVQEKSSTNNDNDNETPEDLPIVEGAIPGSTSNYVVDKEVWNDFVKKEDIDLAKSPIDGIHLPKILLDSEDAKKVNKEIDEDILSQIKKLYLEVKNSDVEGYVDGCNDLGVNSSFSVYEDKNLLSIYIDSSLLWYGYQNIKKVYNFSLPDGKLLSNDEFLERVGIDKKDTLGLMEDSIKRDYDNIIGVENAAPYDSSILIFGMRGLEGDAMEDLWNNFDTYGARFYLNEVGDLMFLYEQYTPAGAGIYTVESKLEEKLTNQNLYSPQYIKMAKALGIDPKDEKIKGIIIYIGSFWDEESLYTVLQRLYPWLAVFNDYKDPNLLPLLKSDPNSSLPKIEGEECYLLVPKWKNAVISLKELEYVEGGTLKEADNYLLSIRHFVGPTLIYQNQSEVFTNAKIIMRYRDDTIEFSPCLSGKDGSVVLPDEIIDGENVLDFDQLVKENFYSDNIARSFKLLMGIDE